MMCGTMMALIQMQEERTGCKAQCPILPMDGVLLQLAYPPSALMIYLSLEE